MRRRRRVLIGLGIVVVLFAGATYRFSPLWSGPSLPAGATRLHIDTGSPHLVPAFGCPAALLSPSRIATTGDNLVLVTVESGGTVRVVWPSGYAAWRLDGRAELVARDGRLVGREGDILTGLGGGSADDGSFWVCEIGG
jgi:hypothetical protein